MAQRGFIHELRRRHVFKVGAAYLVSAWLILQLGAILLPAFDAPHWAEQVLVAVLAVGLLVAVALAWLFEITPEGVRRTEDEGAEAAPTPFTRRMGRYVNAGIIVILAAAVGVLTWRLAARVPQGPGATTKIDPHSIAVLPFENLSADPDNAYFASGIQDEILTRLAELGGLKVISRDSTQQYASHPGDVRTVARALGVANVLEGSVQKSGDEVLINVQLVDARNGQHLWAQSFDRSLEHVFSVEGEVAQQVAVALKAKLSPAEEVEVTRPPTENTGAYQAYLRGIAVGNRAQSAQTISDRIRYFGEATALDPAFALAWAQLALAQSAVCSDEFNRTPQQIAATRTAAENALHYGPDLGEAFLANGDFESSCLGDYKAAEKNYEEARKRLPNSADVLNGLARLAVYRRDFEAGLGYDRKAAELDPRNPRTLFRLAIAYAIQRQMDQAQATLNHALDVAPDDTEVLALKAQLYQAQGNLKEAAAVLAPIPLQPNSASNLFEVQILQWLYRHHYAKATNALQAALVNPDPSLGFTIGEYRYFLAFTQSLAGDAAAAHANYLAARDELEASLKSEPDNAYAVMDLARVQAGLGDRNAALAAAGRAVTMLKSDPQYGPSAVENLAAVQGQVGDVAEAVANLKQLLQMPYLGFYGVPITPALLRLDPVWDPLRKDPAFRALARKRA